MIAAVLLALTALSATTVRAMIAWGPIDQPDARKAHNRPVPKGGGVGVVLAVLAGMAALYAGTGLVDDYLRGVILAATAIAAVALLDDLYDFPFTIKLAAQLAAAALAVGSGLYVGVLNLPTGPLDLGLAGPALTLAWILFATNAMNFIDGLNGLASGVSAIAAAILAVIAAAHGGLFVAACSAALAAGLVGFLPFNFPRARIFMGDVGSQFCGFVLAVLTIAAGRFQGVELSILLVPMLLMGVLFDVAFTLVRRALGGERFWQPHRGHLYQLAHRTGLPATRITLLHWAFAAWGGVCCALFLVAGPWKPFVPLLVLPPQLLWAAYVVRRARNAGLEKW